MKMMLSKTKFVLSALLESDTNNADHEDGSRTSDNATAGPFS